MKVYLWLYLVWLNISCNYRNSYDMYISNGILFNHESPRRGTNFVTNKVVKILEIKYGLSNKLMLGNLENEEEIGDREANHYVRFIVMILEQEQPNDFV